MNKIANVLIRTIAVEFYRMNSGFFLVVITLAFGFMSGREHKALAQFFVSGLPTLMIPAVAWLIYLLHITQFNSRHIRREENRFLYDIVFLSDTHINIVIGACLSVQFIPAIAYGFFLMVIAATVNALYAVVIGGVMILCIAIGTFALRYALLRPNREVKTSLFSKYVSGVFIRPLPQYYAEWLLRREPLLLFSTKVLAGLLLFGVCTLYHRDAYDMRLMGIAVTATGIINILIVYQLVMFEHRHIRWVKNLPIPLLWRFANLFAIAAIFLVPELVVVMKNLPESVTLVHRVTIASYMCAIAAFFIGFLHLKNAPLEYYTKRAFWFFIALTVVILFRVPLLSLAAAAFVIAYVIFARCYYTREA